MNIINAALWLRFAPHFHWNVISTEERLHVGATIERMYMFVQQFCKSKQLLVPEFTFLSSDVFMGIEEFEDSIERKKQTYTSMKRLAADYRREHLSKSPSR